MIRTLLSVAVIGSLSFAGLVYAGDPAPAAPSVPTEKAAPAVDDAKPAVSTEAPKAESPIHVMMGWIAKQVAPAIENPCPATADGEKAWRTWFGGGKDIPLASLRDAMVANGFDADRFVAFFREMVAKSAPAMDCGCDKGESADGKCSEGKCSEGKCGGGKCVGGNCEGAKGAVGSATGAPTGDAAPAAKPSCGSCKDKGAAKDAPKTDAAPAKPQDVPAKP